MTGHIRVSCWGGSLRLSPPAVAPTAFAPQLSCTSGSPGPGPFESRPKSELPGPRAIVTTRIPGRRDDTPQPASEKENRCVESCIQISLALSEYLDPDRGRNKIWREPFPGLPACETGPSWFRLVVYNQLLAFPLNPCHFASCQSPWWSLAVPAHWHSPPS